MAEAKWYVVHTYSGYENKVKANIEKTIENNPHLAEQILEVRVPLQDVVRHVSMIPSDDSSNPSDADILLLGDSVMLRYLRDSITAALRDFCGETEVVVQAQPSGDFVTLTFSSAKGHFTAEQLHNMFYPENLRYDADNDSLHGAQLLIAKQIVRLHDDYVRRGCRIEARPANAKDGSGLSVCVTLPAKL